MIDYRQQEIGPHQDILLIELSGQLDAGACDSLFAAIDAELNEGRHQLILDCDRLQFISSIGLGVFVRVHTKMKQLGGGLKLSRVHGMIREVIELVMLDHVLQIYPTIEAATDDFCRKPKAGS